MPIYSVPRSLVWLLTIVFAFIAPALAQTTTKPNIVVIWGDDIGESNISAYNFGLMGYQTPNIDRLAKEGMMFTDMYADQSCTAGRSSFITGQATIRTGLSKVGMPGAKRREAHLLALEIDSRFTWKRLSRVQVKQSGSSA